MGWRKVGKNVKIKKISERKKKKFIGKLEKNKKIITCTLM